MKLLTVWGYAKLFIDLLLLVLVLLQFIYTPKSTINLAGTEAVNVVSALLDICFLVCFLVGLARKSTKLLRIYSVYGAADCIFLILDIKAYIFFLPIHLADGNMDADGILMIVRLILYSIILGTQIPVTVLTTKLFKQLEHAPKMESGTELLTMPSSAPPSSAPHYSTLHYPAPQSSASHYSTVPSSAPQSYAPQYSAPPTSAVPYPTLVSAASRINNGEYYN